MDPSSTRPGTVVRVHIGAEGVEIRDATGALVPLPDDLPADFWEQFPGLVSRAMAQAVQGAMTDVVRRLAEGMIARCYQDLTPDVLGAWEES